MGKTRRGSSRARVISDTERRIIQTLYKMTPSAAFSYEQALIDLREPMRRSYRGVAHELRETLRETLDQLAPDSDVMAERGFKLEEGRSRPTMRQRASFILRKRNVPAETRQSPELAAAAIEEITASLARSTYERGSKSAHGIATSREVRRMKMYVDAVLADLLEVHR